MYVKKADKAEALRKSHSVWNTMLQRCRNPRNKMYRYYGGATPPVLVCAEWLTFAGFLKAMGLQPPGKILSRRLDSGNYEDGNVKWETHQEAALQARRKRLQKKYGENYGKSSTGRHRKVA